MPDNALFVESVTDRGHRLRVDFFKLADRYGHRLSIVLVDEGGHEKLVPLAESVEGTCDDPWPPSPPLQSLSIEKLAEGRTAALLVGMAGKCHWSASIGTVPNEPEIGTIEFDFACRSADLPCLLASEYRAFLGVEVGLDQKTGLLVLRFKTEFVIIKAMQGCQQPERVADSQFRFALQKQQLRPAETLRWRYRAWLGRVEQSD